MRGARVVIPLVSATAAAVMVGTASAATASDRASLTHGGRIAAGEPISAKVNVHQRFASISSVCFYFTFKDDLLDPAEEIIVTWDSGEFGQENPFDTPLSTVGVCDVDEQAIAQFLDGRQELSLSMESGSVRLARLDVVIDGVPS